VKHLIMNARLVSGIGNIYANEALFSAGIHPLRSANRISVERYQRLAEEVKRVLSNAISAGGTTLRDFQKADGNPGYFGLSLQIYGREGEPCPSCSRPIRRRMTQQRSTYYCVQCQR
jgi:formamidopyrimidine-DNA glycosylase